jgi:hypothetical protein
MAAEVRVLYFLQHDAEVFHGRIAPALAASWRRRTFGPIVGLAAELAPTIDAFAERHHLTADERPLLASLTADCPFDRRLWRHLAGEVLLYAAADAPAIQNAADALVTLVSTKPRETIRQAHAGSRDLEFDGVPYRPGRAGLNDTAAVGRLATELGVIDPAAWSAESLTSLETDDRLDELAFARECFAGIRDLYERARRANQVVVCEDI